jgi:Na+/melibiose symporter-like transporter
MVYSANNLPYSALSGVITGSMPERNSISSYRFFAVMVAQFIIQVLLLPLVLIAGHGDKAAGFEKVMTIFAILGVICFIITFLTTKERIIPSPEQKSSVKQDLTDLVHNKPWIIMLIVTVFIFITLALKGGTYVYYFNYYLDKQSLAAFLSAIGFNGFISNLNVLLGNMGLVGFHWPEDAATSAFSLFNAGGIIFMIVGIALSKGLADKYGKRDVFGFGLITATLAQLMFYVYPPTSIALVFITQILHGFFYGLTIPLLWAMIADVADYSEWKNNRRATGIIFSAMIFGLKAGLSIGGSLVAAILAFFGYHEGLAVQSAATVQGIRLAMSVFPAITFGVAIVSLLFYEINKNMEVTIENELKIRHNR